MREIKFRAWDVKNKLYIYVDGFVIEEETKTIRLFWKYITTSKTFFDQSFPIDQILLEQYTGRKDTNNKEIYEEDKCLYDAIHGKICQIKWDETLSRFLIQTEKKYDYAGLTQFTEMELEIIGNIHENPELLND